MINLEGLTKQKYIELESMLNDKGRSKNVIVITETQQKTDKTRSTRRAQTFAREQVSLPVSIGSYI